MRTALLLLVLAACRQDAATCGVCEGEQVCVGASCEDAFGRSYDFTIGLVTMPPLDGSGGGWDGLTDNTPPDPHVALSIADVVFLETPPASDTFSHDFGVTSRIQIGSGTTLHVAVSDADLNDTFEAAFDCDLPLTAAGLRTGELTCTSAAGDGSAVIAVEAR